MATGFVVVNIEMCSRLQHCAATIHIQDTSPDGSVPDNIHHKFRDDLLPRYNQFLKSRVNRGMTRKVIRGTVIAVVIKVRNTSGSTCKRSPNNSCMNVIKRKIANQTTIAIL
jgi:hypothetical protein